LLLENLRQQVIQNVVMASGKGLHKPLCIFAALDREGGQMQAGNPTLGAVVKGRDVVRRQFTLHYPLQKVERFRFGESEFRLPDFHHLSARPHSGQGQRGVGPGGDGQMQLGRQVLEQEG
jgi:hypothetical protein